MSQQWCNWAGTQRATATQVVSPQSTEEISHVVAGAVERGLPVKPVGSGHSFTGIALTDGIRLQMDAFDDVTEIDTDTGLVTVESGVILHRLSTTLWRHGLALTNLGDIDVQTLAGAVSTGTHGTGAAFGGLATQIRALEMVLADGSVVWCSADERPELFAAARVGLGALGVITKVTLQCEPAYALHAREEPAHLSDVLDDVERHLSDNDHFEFFWFPHTDRVLAKAHNRLPLDRGLRPLTRVRRWIDDELLSNRVYELVCRLGVRAPGLIPRLNQISARALTSREYVDASFRVLTTRRAVRFHEMEYAVPRESVGDLLRAVQQWVDRHDERISFPVEVRFAAGDDIWLSTAYEPRDRLHRGAPVLPVAVHDVL